MLNFPLMRSHPKITWVIMCPCDLIVFTTALNCMVRILDAIASKMGWVILDGWAWVLVGVCGVPGAGKPWPLRGDRWGFGHSGGTVLL
ncbi:MAG: hypothetical protein AAFV72_20320 [Cyanobacteria bacterium J06635_1]